MAADYDVDRLQGALRRPSVKKNVGAIHVAGRLTLLQRKIGNVLLLNAYDTLTQRRTHSIDARTLMMMVGYNSNDTATLKGALRGLVETVVEWDMLDPEGRQEWGVSSLLAQARLRDGVCDYAYAPAMAEKLADPKVFALINLDIQRRFASGHALALYENCYRFVRVRSTGWWPLETFRRLMGVEDSDYYRTFKHLNAKIIKPAVAEVNRTSNIHLTPEFVRKGRAVTDIRFAIRENAQAAALDLGSDDLRAGRVHARLVGQGVSDRLARQWIADHGPGEVERRLDYVAGRGDLRAPAAYLTAAMERAAVTAAAPAAAPPAAPAPAVPPAPATPAPDEAERAARLAEAGEMRRRLAIVEAAAARRSPVQRDADRRLFLETLEDDLDRGEFRRHGWGSRLNAAAICAFWEEMSPGLFDSPPEGAGGR